MNSYGKPHKSSVSKKKFGAQQREHQGQAVSLLTAIVLPVAGNRIQGSDRSQYMVRPRTTADKKYSKGKI